ncbi:MAG TPA: proton-conducting transporter membrane subunit, partial [Candidatus Deferrimicrobium sp.]|nr:proton-conducting transporter membrane subunit [Candidatus Deferrimicrobium sp.]
MNLFLYSIVIYLAAGIMQTMVPDRLKPWIFMGFSAPASFMAITASLQVLITGNTVKTIFAFPYPLGDVTCVMDSLSAFFVLITAIMGFTAAVYAAGYLKPYLNKNRAIGAHYFYMSLLLAFILLVTVIQNALAFLIAWEIMSLSSFFLVAFENEKKEVFDAALHYLIAMHVGVIFLISAFLLLSIKSGSFDFNSFSAVLRNGDGGGRLVSLLFVFFFIGFGTKAGFFPFHVWLPKAHPAAPGHISGIMSAVMIKTGIYGILRVLTLIGTPPKGLGYFVLGISLVSAVMGILYAMTQRDTKWFLAYSSIENIGIMGIGMGIGMLGLSYGSLAMVVLGFGGCLIHLLNHAVFKSLLFFAVGTVYQRTHLRNMEKMGGLIHRMPYTAAFSLAGSAAICGLPPMNGFIGKFLLYFAMVKGIQVENPLLNVVGIFAIAVLGFVGAAASMAFAKMFSIVFLGAPRKDIEVSEAKPIMLIP